MQTHTVSLILFSTAVILLLHLKIVRFFRYQRRERISSAFRHGRTLDTMTTKEAHDIMVELQELEFPFAFKKARTIALLKAGGIPSMSRLFAATGQNNRRNAGKRAVDTEVLLREAHVQERKHFRYQQAVARMNFLHSRYRKAGKIIDSDLLHTLGSGLIEVYRIVNQDEWRSLSDVEFCALGVFHKCLGDDMEIAFDALPSHARGWRDGGHFAMELMEWTTLYERSAAVPSPTNDQYIQVYVDSAASTLPKAVRLMFRQAIGFELDNTMRASLGIEAPSRLFSSFLTAIVEGRKLILKYLSLPRSSRFAIKLVRKDVDATTGRLNFDHFGLQPWYVRPSIWRSLHPLALFLRALGGKSPGSEGDKYESQGYDLSTIGPSNQQGKGSEEMAATREKIAANSLVSCPFHRA